MTGILKSSSDSYALMDAESGSLSNISHDSRFSSTRSKFLPSSIESLKKIVIFLAVLVITLFLILFIVSMILAFSKSSIVSEIKESETDGENSKTQAAQTQFIQESTQGYRQESSTSKTIRTPTPPYPLNEGTISRLSVTQVNGKNVEPGALIFDEEFDSFNYDNSDNRSNESTWKHIIGISESKFHFAVNDTSNSFVRDGKLFIKATYTSDKYGEDFIYNGSLLLGIHLTNECKNESISKIYCWKEGYRENIIHPIMSAMISTEKSFNFKYGKVEIKAKMPSGDWLEPMIALQPKSYAYGKTGLLSGQMHLVDIRGNRKLFNPNGINVGSERNCPDIRYGSGLTEKTIYSCKNTPEDQGFDREFHLYTLEWTPEKIIVKIDEDVIVNAPESGKSLYDLWKEGRFMPNPWWNAKDKAVAPFDQEFNILIGLAAGGTSGFYPDVYTGPYPKPWSNTDPKAAKSFWEKRQLWEPSWDDDSSALQIDYIRIKSLETTI